MEKNQQKKKEQLLAASQEELTFEERILQSILERKPDMTLEEAQESLEMLP